MKYAWYIVAAVLIVALCLGAYFYGWKPAVTETIIQPVETRIIYRQLPAVVITAPDGHEIATLDTTLTNVEKTATAQLKLRYDEKDNLFDIDAKLTSQQITKYIKDKPPFIGLCAGVGIGILSVDSLSTWGLQSADIEAGVTFAGKYDIKAFINTEKTAGIRFGVRF